VEVDLPLGALGLEVRGGVIDRECHRLPPNAM
jgi:hypothetical protein